ncbi:MAG: ATP-binding protein, partial [Candidatus Eremiobacterota bacterium]
MDTLVEASGRSAAALPAVLVVDDEPQVLSTLRDLLEDDYDLITVTDGRQALEVLRDRDISVVLTDQRMPSMTGDQLLARAAECSRATRVLLTGYIDHPALVRAVNDGHVYAYIPKPWDPAQLRVTLAQAVKHYHLVRSLHVEQELLHQLMEQVPDCILFLDRKGRFTRINRATAAFLGLEDTAAATGRPAAELMDSHLAALGEKLLRVVLDRQAVDEVMDLEVDGAARTVSVSAVPLQAHLAGGAAGVALLRDITQVRLLQQELLQAQKMEALGRLAAGVAHDFNNLLTVILGNCSLMADLQRAEVEEIGIAAERSASLVRQLLAFSRSQPLRPQRVEVDRILQDNLPLFQRLCRRKAELQVQPGAPGSRVLADPGQLTQVFLNLIVNAVEAVSEGGLVVVSTALESDGYLRCTVRDTGKGIPPEVQSRIFEPFFTTRADGNGLGLATVYGIVHQSGGHIGFTSEVGQGTEFTLRFPVSSSEALPPEGSRPPAATWLQPTPAPAARQGPSQGRVLV